MGVPPQLTVATPQNHWPLPHRHFSPKLDFILATLQ